MSKPETCYACARPPRGLEHVPPRAFFPEKKDLPPGVSLREGLITVPSCNRHNLAKAQDDEYLLFVIATNFEANPVAQFHYATKLRRAILRRPSIKALFRGIRPITVQGVVTGVYLVDEGRARRSLSLLAKALFFHHFHERWRGQLYIVAPSFLRVRAATSPSYSKVVANLEEASNRMFQHERRFGRNPKVFYYQVHEGTSRSGVIIRMVFYGLFSCSAFRQRALVAGSRPRRAA